MPFRYLDDATLDAVRTAAVDLGFAGDEETRALTRDLPPSFVAAALPSGGNPAARLFAFTGTLNTTRVLVTGEVPLHRWLKAAIFLAAGREEEAVFRRALEVCSVDGVAAPAAPAVPPPTDAAALPQQADGHLEVQIGSTDDTLEVGFLHSGAALSRSVAKLLVHRHVGGVPLMLGNKPQLGNGTGWLVAPRLLMTNHHVVDARLPPFEPPATAQDFALQGAATTVIFDFFTDGAAGTRTAATGCVASDAGLDYALLRLPDDAPDRPPLPLRTTPIIKPTEQALRDRINVLQHPDGKPMRLGFRNNYVVTGTDERLSYLTDTAGGASGSPLCDDAWFVAGLHRGFARIAPLTLWGETIDQENHGTPITRIVAHLKQEHPDLHEEVLAGQALLRQG